MSHSTTIRQTLVRVSHCVAVDDAHPLQLAELARAVGQHEQWVLQLVEAGLIAPTEPQAPAAQWAFAGEALRCAREARRLQRDFDVDLQAAALIIDLQQEVRRLRALLGRAGQGLE
ncbi:MerR family transcriptional regulator [Xenophilus arseniciresistens]|uniref:MerR family transcriptional regulator n=1 Tax=Xenophilus arseniciresistens TaxID=1283306 RepID=A0AAE3SYT4_9BURK|nr:chaperone modulator CbpM [Xenophilus arseniciresistens]MDA7415131.1 MerR family transcriptional regulator [Xenophilus arseniciresistens]